jgi:hypothetical protein
MSVLLSLTVAFPLVCLAFLSLLGLVGIMALGGVMHMIVAAKARVSGTGASSLARSQSVPGGSHNPSIELARPGMLKPNSSKFRRPKAAPPPMYSQ